MRARSAILVAFLLAFIFGVPGGPSTATPAAAQPFECIDDLASSQFSYGTGGIFKGIRVYGDTYCNSTVPVVGNDCQVTIVAATGGTAYGNRDHEPNFCNSTATLQPAVGEVTGHYYLTATILTAGYRWTYAHGGCIIVSPTVLYCHISETYVISPFPKITGTYTGPSAPQSDESLPRELDARGGASIVPDE